MSYIKNKKNHFISSYCLGELIKSINNILPEHTRYGLKNKEDLSVQEIEHLLLQARSSGVSEAIFLQSGAQLNFGTLGFPADIARLADSPYHAYSLFIHYSPLLTNLINIQVKSKQGQLVVSLDNNNLSDDLFRNLAEYFICAHNTAIMKASPDAKIITRLAWDKPPQTSLALYQNLLGQEVTFGCQTTEICFPENVIKLQMPLHRIRMRNALMLEANSLMEGNTDEQGIVEKTRSTISELLGNRALSLSSVAESFNLTTKTFQRRLAAEGTVFNDEVNDIRREMMEELIADKQLPLKQIAVNLGFKEPRSFNRWVHQNYGKAPAELRAQ
ncbi:helix-turn-helix domain-containing protein [Parendozoicomonas haliclonae]|uniref:HTH-type transcriptional regulator VirS n=1 Tax=Parendozoicomonas haliclonae TaxID=1960125 RepID=A0A1X7AQF5_9GAMM|nr:helix-turn-helix domain-containing protein [Parendozoicomonas haliclonae]SMA50544.1 HTH-type transcriptional regulator VirS [Parendozoicomonas haliclonae]